MGTSSSITIIWHRIIKTLQHNIIMLSAAVITMFILLSAIFGRFMAPHDPLITNISFRLQCPSKSFPLGNDALGRCLFSRILIGARLSLGIGLTIVFFSCSFGTLVGLISGYFGNYIDEFFMRITDIFFSFPELVLAMTAAGLLGPGIFNLILALSLTSWMRYAKVVRGITLSVKEQDYVKAARLAGSSKVSIILRHISVSNIPSIIVLATLGLAKAILSVSALGFLGFGVQPPNTEWGMLLMEGKDYILSASHLSFYPGLAIMISVQAFNILGDGLRDILDIRLE
ncbi:MAG: ABC transporter permease [bacterium]